MIHWRVAAALCVAFVLVAASAGQAAPGPARGAKVCAALQVRLPNRFAAHFASVADCRATVAAAAQAAIASCKGDSDVKACVRSALANALRGKVAALRAAVQTCASTTTPRTPEFRACVSSALGTTG